MLWMLGSDRIELPLNPISPCLGGADRDLRDEPIAFLNLNELEITVGNQEQMDVRGTTSVLARCGRGWARIAIRLRDRVLAPPWANPTPSMMFRERRTGTISSSAQLPSRMQGNRANSGVEPR